MDSREDDEEEGGQPAPRPPPVWAVDLQPGVARGEDGADKDEDGHGSHHGPRDDEGQLGRLKPAENDQSQMSRLGGWLTSPDRQIPWTPPAVTSVSTWRL